MVDYKKNNDGTFTDIRPIGEVITLAQIDEEIAEHETRIEVLKSLKTTLQKL